MLFRTQWVKVSDKEEELVAVELTPQKIKETAAALEVSELQLGMNLARSKETYFTSGSNPKNIGKRQPYIPPTPEEESGILWD